MKPLPLPLNRTASPAAADMNRGISHGVEIAGVLLFFFFIGFVLDHVFSTKPWFMVIFTVLGILGIFVRAWYGYTYEMDRHEMDRLEAQGRAPAAAPATGTDQPS